ncbi:MAG: T9SS type A sorting domain-containing protein, partial [Flavobacteriales bacterium]|nr:T9SS type A sorting domain-containing protein [Flavobacteriales bacterium]
WLVTLGGPEDDIGKSLTVSSDHELRAVGYFNDTALINSFGVYSDTLYSEAFRDFFIINCDVNNQIIVSTETSIDLAGDINLFPNPASEYVKVQIEGEFSKFTNYSVLDNLGRIVISNTESGNEFTISTASLKPGYYHLLLNNNSIQAKRRLIIY